MIRHDPIPSGEEFRVREKTPTTVCRDDREASRRAASIIAETVRANNEGGKPTVLGLATGHTPIGVYRELIRMHREEDLDLGNVITFNLDEYYPMPPDSLQSYRRWMQANFFDHVNIAAERIHVPDGTIPEKKIAAYCREYEHMIRDAGGIDVQILGIGRTGHIGFNEPGSSRESRTRLISLDPVTRKDAASDFFGEANVPKQAITMGVGTILSARRILLLAFGEQKAPIIRRAVEGPVTDAVAASFLQDHPSAEVIIDVAAAADLTRVATPWLLGDVEWTARNLNRAVIWLSLETGKCIHKLDADDYVHHHLASLVRYVGLADRLNHHAFSSLSEKITYKHRLPTDKNMLVFSPHPDDDVISMGGTITRLGRCGNNVYVTYMTSGNIAVADEHTLQMLEFWGDVNHAFDIDPKECEKLEKRIRDALAAKRPGEVDIPEVQEIKGLIRRSEALAACRWMGIPDANASFLDLPFYETGEVRKRPISDDDVEIVLAELRRIRPHWIFVAGEMSDPHGTHRLCAEAIFLALAKLEPDERPEIVWLYRGAWQEWEPDVIDMLIPLSRAELMHKIFGIFRHQSQKDKALFPGPYDDREFWQRAEARNTETAATFNKLGLPEYHAMEAFVRYDFA